MRNFFDDVPRFEDEHIVGPSEFYTHVGRCIKRWADLEGFLFENCDWALNGERSLAAIVHKACPDPVPSLPNEGGRSARADHHEIVVGRRSQYANDI